MFNKKSYNNKAFFEEKYGLYGDMLYKLGIIYFGPGENNQVCQEAISEAFLWLLTRKKGFKSSEKERLELIKHMVLICKSKSRKESKRIPGEKKENSEDACLYSESTFMLEAAYGLPIKYKPVLHLYFHEGLDITHISKMLSIPIPVVDNLISKGTELMEMVMECKLDKKCYCSIFDGCRIPSDIKEEIYLYLTEGKPHVKAYLSPLQKVAAVLIAMAVIAFCMTVILIYPQVKSAILVKHAFSNGTIRSVNLRDISVMDGDGVFFSYSENGYQGYTLSGNSMEQLETRHINETIDYRGIQFNIDFSYCIKDGHLVVMNPIDRSETRADISPINGRTDSVLITLIKLQFIDNDNDDDSFIYPIAMDLNTLSTTDFLSGCNLQSINGVTGITVNDSLSGAIAITKENGLYYCDVKNHSIKQIVSLEGNSSCSIYSMGFSSNDTAIYCIYTLRDNGMENTQSFYEYSISSNSIRKCYEFNSTLDKRILYFGKNSVLLRNSDNIYSVVDIRTGVSTDIPSMPEDVNDLIFLPSPDERYVLFGCCTSDPYGLNVKSIYVYDTITRKNSILNLSDYKGMSFAILYWYDNNNILLQKRDIAADNTDSSSAEGEAEYTLWILDVTKLK